ncbi:pentatricopeptide repeat-containing protein At2g13600-like isoform X2 [Selaginella moellendorffii]|uniref:pentatricopeptide repeat-containing protein At2g13600-like isoform X2 n=1 Tax=Selaginella moellendorffii TaxID=88036 RepID=UPI000D1CBDCD|nr:pentatricopeptide repeat-containing protein At2g13600-like isoform X2 [Selaginella moellendorffii]|eukprot:XP_024538078.1 pentatricopeptide repeat-containing protein At2g13600-like isoform X2 [Selaginella moellendorffii]
MRRCRLRKAALPIIGHNRNLGGRFLFSGFEEEEERIDHPSLVAALKACSATKDLESGKRIHSPILGSDGSHSPVTQVSNALISMYGKCHSMIDARSIFDSMPHKDLVSWNSLAFGYAVNGEPGRALEILGAIQASGTLQPNARTFLAALLACSSLADEEIAKLVDGKLFKSSCLERTVAIHLEAGKRGCLDVYVSTSLVDLYAKCGSVLEAARVFHRMPSHSVVSWSTLIQGYVENHENEVALGYYELMGDSRIPPDCRTHVAALMACSSLALREEGREVNGKVVKTQALEKGMAVHSRIDKLECTSDVILASTVVHFYAKCGRLEDAGAVFEAMLRHDEISWNTLIMGYVENGEYELALELFSRMRLEKCSSSRATVAVLMACASLAAREQGKELDGMFVKAECLQKGMEIHREAVVSGCDSDGFVASSLVDMYAKCGSMKDARAAFDRMAYHDVVSWTTLILGYAENGLGELALDLFSQMTSGAPNHLTYVAALVACGNLSALDSGRKIHSRILRSGLETEVVVESSLVDFYCKCGSMDTAESVFFSMQTKRLVTWSALIAGYSRQGDTLPMFDHFRKLRDEGLQPNGITVLSVLTACSHAGLVDKGKKIFNSMLAEFGVKPEIDHYHCIVDLLSRANRLEEAVELVQSLRCEDSYLAWTTILSGACKWNNLQVGEKAFQSLMKLEDRDDDAACVLMGNLYGRAGLWERRAQLLECNAKRKN